MDNSARVHEWLLHAATLIQAQGFEAATLEAQVLLKHALKVDRSWLYAHPTDSISTELANQLLERRLGHEPLAYIVGHREFYGREFIVTPAVLIPRQETELLVDLAKEFRNSDPAPIRILDIGTGSGCIAISIALELPDADVWAVDISESALSVARQNADQLGAKVQWVHSDLVTSLKGEPFDLIISNPPYIDSSESIPAEVRDFEPPLALFAKDGGLEIYHRLSLEAKTFLKIGGQLAVEVGHEQAAIVTELFQANGWNLVKISEDLAGIPRVVQFQISKSARDIT
jgi:release factor glutamine methyltransferase